MVAHHAAPPRGADATRKQLDLSRPIPWESEGERQAAIAFFNAAFRAEESGLTQAHALADEVSGWDPELGECLRLYGDEEGWHRELLTKFLAHIGGEVRPMGRVTGTFYRLYGRAKRVETIVLTNLMFETIGSTTYRLALREARYPAVRQMLTILTRDESFHVPLNVHFLREALKRSPPSMRIRLRAIYTTLFAALLGSAAASRRRALAFDRIPSKCSPAPTPSTSGGSSSTRATSTSPRRRCSCACSGTAGARSRRPRTRRPSACSRRKRRSIASASS